MNITASFYLTVEGSRRAVVPGWQRKATKCPGREQFDRVAVIPETGLGYMEAKILVQHF